MGSLWDFIIYVLENHTDAVVTAVSIFFATLLGFIGFSRDQQRQKKLHTLTVLSEVDKNELLVKANFHINQMIIDGVEPDYMQMSEEQRVSVLTMLNYYEFISTALRMGALDRKSMVVQRYGLMKSTFNYFKPFIDFRREKLNRPHTFEGVEFIVESEAEFYNKMCDKYAV